MFQTLVVCVFLAYVGPIVVDTAPLVAAQMDTVSEKINEPVAFVVFVYLGVFVENKPPDPVPIL